MALSEIFAIASMLSGKPVYTKKPKDKIAVKHADTMDRRIQQAKERNKSNGAT